MTEKRVKLLSIEKEDQILTEEEIELTLGILS